MSTDTELDSLLQRAAAGDAAARQDLLARYEKRLKRMLSVRMDRRLAARVDPSDVLPETYMDAWQKLSNYLQERPVEFYPWLRSIAWERLVDVHRAHVGAEKRSVKRERRHAMALPSESTVELVGRIAASGTSVSVQLVRKEVQERLALGLEKLRPADREVLVLRYLEQLSVKDVAGIVGVSEGAVKVRCFRAVERLHALLEAENPDRSSGVIRSKSDHG